MRGVCKGENVEILTVQFQTMSTHIHPTVSNHTCPAIMSRSRTKGALKTASTICAVICSLPWWWRESASVVCRLKVETSAYHLIFVCSEMLVISTAGTHLKCYQRVCAHFRQITYTLISCTWAKTWQDRALEVVKFFRTKWVQVDISAIVNTRRLTSDLNFVCGLSCTLLAKRALRSHCAHFTSHFILWFLPNASQQLNDHKTGRNLVQ